MISIGPGYQCNVTVSFTDRDGNTIDRPRDPSTITPERPQGSAYDVVWPLVDLPSSSYGIECNPQHALLRATGTEPGILRVTVGPYSAALGVNAADPDPQPVGDVNVILTAGSPVPTKPKK